MKNKKAPLTGLLSLLFFSPVSNASAQNTESSTLPLHVEANMEAGTPYHKMMPMGATVDLGYYINRFSIHAMAQGDYFIPKESSTYKYNNTSNVGGGLGYVLFPDKGDHLGVMEARAYMTTSFRGNSAMKNNSYKIGIYWYGNSTSRKVVPMVSVGYTIKNFHTNGMPTYRGAYVSFGLRF